jgi:hypothetical protein
MKMMKFPAPMKEQSVQGPSAVGARGNPLGQTPWADPTKYTASTFYIYEVDLPLTAGGDTTPLAAGASLPLTFQIAQDSDFFWTKLCAFALVADTATTRSADQLPAVTALIVNTTTGRQYSSNPVPLPNFAGNAQFPFILPVMTLFQNKSVIQINLFNEGDVDYSNLQLSFIGVKAFTVGS